MYTEYYYKLLDAYKVLKALREMDDFKDVPAKNFDFALFFIGNAAGALQKKAWDEVELADTVERRERRERRDDAERLAGAIWRNADEAAILRLAHVLNYLPSQLANDIDALFSFVTEHADHEREQLDE